MLGGTEKSANALDSATSPRHASVGGPGRYTGSRLKRLAAFPDA